MTQEERLFPFRSERFALGGQPGAGMGFALAWLQDRGSEKTKARLPVDLKIQ